MSVKNVRAGELTCFQPLQKMAQERRFSRARFARKNQEPAVRFNAEHQFSERGFVSRPGKQKTRVRRYVKWILSQPERAKHMIVDRRCTRRGHRTPRRDEAWAIRIVCDGNGGSNQNVSAPQKTVLQERLYQESIVLRIDLFSTML